MKKAKGAGRKAKGKARKPQGRRPASAANIHVVGDKQLRALQKKIEKQTAMRWNPNSAEVQRSVIKLVLTLVELIRQLMERQAIRRLENKTMTAAETEVVGKALMEIEKTVRDIGGMFDLSPEDLNLDLGAIKLL